MLIPIKARVLKRRWKNVTTGCLILQGFSTGLKSSNWLLDVPGVSITAW